ncbi:unnamed protein product [Schistosoma intercalatum]|nr:unnamed protein product [Schistosoma intercalatum]
MKFIYKFKEMCTHCQWTPIAMPEMYGVLLGEHAGLIHACSDALRQYCESLWYSGLEYKRPTHEEILAKCGILFYGQPIPVNILYAFYYQLENLFAMSKVIHSIRTVMDWLDATENHASRILSIYEMNSQLNHFEETLADHLKALKLCDRLLDNLGSIYHRVRPLKKGQTILARALTDFESKQMKCKLHMNHFYRITSNQNPHAWQISNPGHAIPSLFLDVSTEFGEKLILKQLQKRFEEFLIMCHGRARRQLFSRITKLLHNSKRYSTLPAMFKPSDSPVSSSALCGLYFPRSPDPAKRWRPSNNAKIFSRQPAYLDYESPQEALLPHTIRILLTRLRNWLHQLPPPGVIMDSSKLSTFNSNKCQQNSFNLIQGSNVVNELRTWWKFTHKTVENRDQLEKIVADATFIKKLNDIMQTKINTEVEKHGKQYESNKNLTNSSTFKSHPKLTKVLVDELLSRIGAQFYHPRSGQFSYRSTQRVMDGIDIALPYTFPGVQKFDRLIKDGD